MQQSSQPSGASSLSQQQSQSQLSYPSSHSHLYGQLAPSGYPSGSGGASAGYLGVPGSSVSAGLDSRHLSMASNSLAASSSPYQLQPNANGMSYGMQSNSYGMPTGYMYQPSAAYQPSMMNPSYGNPYNYSNMMPSMPPSMGMNSAMSNPSLLASMMPSVPVASSPSSLPGGGAMTPSSISNLSAKSASVPTSVAPKIEVGQARKRKKAGSTGSRSRADADARANRIRKHNEAEVRRRQRLKCLLTELAESVECTKTHKSAILRTAIERVRVMANKLREFGVNVSALMATADDETHEKEGAEEDDDEEEGGEENRRKDGTTPSDEQANVKVESAPVTAGANQNGAASSRAASPLNGHQAKKQRLLTPPVDQSSSAAGAVTPSTVQPHAFVPNNPIMTSQLPSAMGINAPTSALGVNHHALFHSAQVPMDIIDHAGNILDCNEAFAKFTGYSRSILTNPGTTFLGLTHPDSLNASYKLMSGLISGKQTVTRARKKYVTNTGAIRNCIVTCWLIAPTDGTNTPAGTPLIQALIEEIPIESELTDEYFDLPYQPSRPMQIAPNPIYPPSSIPTLPPTLTAPSMSIPSSYDTRLKVEDRKEPSQLSQQFSNPTQPPSVNSSSLPTQPSPQPSATLVGMSAPSTSTTAVTAPPPSSSSSSSSLSSSYPTPESTIGSAPVPESN